MTLPASGVIKFSDLNTEVGYSPTRRSSMGDAAFLLMRGNAAHPILISQFYNKCNLKMTASIDSLGNNFGFYDGYNSGGAGTFGSLLHTAGPVLTAACRALFNELSGVNTNRIHLVLTGNLGQNYFTSLSIGSVGGGTPTTLLSSGSFAVSFDGGTNTSSWVWPAAPNILSGGSGGTNPFYVFLN